MSEKYTSISTPHGGLGELGYITYEEAIEATRKYYQHQMTQADAVLDDLSAGRVTVEHHRGVYVRTNVKEVLP